MDSALIILGKIDSTVPIVINYRKLTWRPEVSMNPGARENNKDNYSKFKPANRREITTADLTRPHKYFSRVLHRENLCNCSLFTDKYLKDREKKKPIEFRPR